MSKEWIATDRLREGTIDALGPWSTRGYPARPYAEVAAEIGINASTLFRFINGNGARSETLDAIAAWLGRNDKRRTKP